MKRLTTMDRIEVVHKLSPGAKTPGILREKAFDLSTVLFSKSTIPPGSISAWHHHGTRDLYGYTIGGRLRLEYGRQGKEMVEVREGDFFRIPSGLVHRDVNPESAQDAVVVSVLIGDGQTTINVEGPEMG